MVRAQGVALVNRFTPRSAVSQALGLFTIPRLVLLEALWVSDTSFASVVQICCFHSA